RGCPRRRRHGDDPPRRQPPPAQRRGGARMNEPIRVFIGTEPAQRLPTEVLKLSIRRRTALPVEFTELSDLACGVEARFFTGFSFYRWFVPWFCDYRGRAIYLDADIVCLCDLAGLWNR